MPLSDIAQISITTTPGGPTRQGFGIPLILAHDAWSTNERTRTYTSLPAVQADFPANTPTYKAAAALFSGDNSPPTIMVGKVNFVPTQSWSIEIHTVAAGTYAVRVNSATASYVATGSDTNDSIVTGLVSAINALAQNQTAAATGSVGSKTIALTGAGAGDAGWAGVEVLNTTLMELTETTNVAAWTAATDLTAILNENHAWYCLIATYNPAAAILQLAAWTEANGRTYAATSSDTDVVNDADSGATDIAHQLKAASYARTFLLWHPANDYFASAAWAGEVLPMDPGSETWKFKTLHGVPVTTLTATQQTNLEAKFANYYYAVTDGADITSEGVVAANEFIDVIRFRDWLTINMQADVVQALMAAKKIPMTDGGVTLMAGVIGARLTQGVKQGGLAPDPKPVVTAPAVKDIPSADRTARKLSGMGFTATLAGAIHSIVVTGSIST